MAEYKSKHTGAQIDDAVDRAKAAILTVNGTAPDADGNVVVSGGGGGGSNYTLPTASETVKGGVKIGEGLEMDGETLNARELAYELIEEFIVPEGGIAEFRRSEEPDGTPYNFKALRVKTIMDKAASANLSPNIIAYNGSTQVGNAYINSIANTGGGRWAVIEVYLKRGAWWAHGCNAATSEGNILQPYTWAKSGDLKETEYPVIDKLLSFASYPAGFKFIIEAVRA